MAQKVSRRGEYCTNIYLSPEKGTVLIIVMCPQFLLIAHAMKRPNILIFSPSPNPSHYDIHTALASQAKVCARVAL